MNRKRKRTGQRHTGHGPIVPVKIDQIPIELQELRQWVGWKYEERNGNETKVPVDLKTCGRAHVNGSATWGSFRRARKCYRRLNLDGIGFVFTEEDDFFGIDLDACRNPDTGELTPWAAEIVQDMASYTEVSPSGYGVKLIARGRIPEGARGK